MTILTTKTKIFEPLRRRERRVQTEKLLNIQSSSDKDQIAKYAKIKEIQEFAEPT